MPPPDLQLSTFNVDDLASEEIWTIGDASRLEQRKEELYGREQGSIAGAASDFVPRL
jgi:hypothetical protein